VQPGTPLMTIAPAGATELTVQIDEKNLALLHPGQAALASADAYPGERFAAVRGARVGGGGRFFGLEEGSGGHGAHLIAPGRSG